MECNNYVMEKTITQIKKPTTTLLSLVKKLQQEKELCHKAILENKETYFPKSK